MWCRILEAGAVALYAPSIPASYLLHFEDVCDATLVLWCLGALNLYLGRYQITYLNLPLRLQMHNLIVLLYVYESFNNTVKFIGLERHNKDFPYLLSSRLIRPLFYSCTNTTTSNSYKLHA